MEIDRPKTLLKTLLTIFRSRYPYVLNSLIITSLIQCGFNLIYIGEPVDVLMNTIQKRESGLKL